VNLGNNLPFDLFYRLPLVYKNKKQRIAHSWLIKTHLSVGGRAEYYYYNRSWRDLNGVKNRVQLCFFCN
jgi:hypothetical protein